MGYEGKPFKSFFKPEPAPKKDKKAQWYAMKKRSLEKSMAKNKPLQDADDKFLRGLWSEIETHVCENCGCSLGSEFKKWFADHKIEKSTHPELRYEVFNIWWLCLICHRNKTDLKLSTTMIAVLNDAAKYFGIDS
jgi:5-methylcytosine-specific restriction endonuclease McrA